MNIPNPTLIVASSYALYLAYNANANGGVYGIFERFIEGPIYQSYRKTIKYAIEKSNNIYHPLSADGVTRRILPDANVPRIFKALPRMVSDCKSFHPWKIRGLQLRNRIIRGAAFDGNEVYQMVKTHEDVSAGGVGLTVVAYCSVSADGRTFDGQIVLKEEEDAKKRLLPVVEAVHKHGGAICAQLTHAGSFAERPVIKTQQVSASVVFNLPGLDFPRAATKEDIERLTEDFAHGAVVACKSIGFDAVELHCGHGYLLSQWMSPYHNRRTDEYGGSALNRVRFPIMCLKAVRRALGEEIPILVKMNANDGIYNGLELPDALIMAEQFALHGADVIVVTCGNVARNGFFMLRGATQVDKLALALPGPLMKSCTAVFGPFLVADTPFETCFLRHEARAILDRIKQYKNVHVCLMGGVDSLGEIEGAMEEGFSAVQIIRPLIREPDFVLRMKKELMERSEEDVDEEFDVASKCIRCNQCVLSSVNPDVEFGCPFRNMEEAASLAKNGKSLKVSKTMANSMIKDIEEIGCYGSRL